MRERRESTKACRLTTYGRSSAIRATSRLTRALPSDTISSMRSAYYVVSIIQSSDFMMQLNRRMADARPLSQVEGEGRRTFASLPLVFVNRAWRLNLVRRRNVLGARALRRILRRSRSDFCTTPPDKTLVRLAARRIETEPVFGANPRLRCP